MLDTKTIHTHSEYIIGKMIPLQARCGPEGGYSSMTAALEGGEWSAACPGRTLPPGKTRYPFYKRLGGPQGRSGRAENLVPNGIRSRIVQPVVSRYTDWATRPTSEYVIFIAFPLHWLPDRASMLRSYIRCLSYCHRYSPCTWCGLLLFSWLCMKHCVQF